MKERITIDFIRAATIRAIKTAAQVMLSMITVGMAITDINWGQILAIAATSAAYSLLTSVAFGIPEGEFQGTLSFQQATDEDHEGEVLPVMQLNISGNELLNRNNVNIKVEKENIDG